MDRARLVLPPRGSLKPNSSVDPLPYYYRPLIGRIFRARIDLGLGLLEGKAVRLLEIGYGSGLLLPTLSSLCEELYGLDLQPEPPDLRAALASLGAAPTLTQGDVAALPFADEFFDVVVAFSILEHLPASTLSRAAVELGRVLRSQGRLLVGCPAVHKAMNRAFSLIGFAGIEAHHVSSIADVTAAFAPYFTIERLATLPQWFARAPLGWAPYTNVLYRKRS